MGLVRSTSFGRKRIFLSDLRFGFGDDYVDKFRKRRCFQDSFFGPNKATSSIEDFPGELLIRHDDLKSFFSCPKQSEKLTPRKNLVFQRAEDFDNDNEVEAPNAPKQSRNQRLRMSVKKLAHISVNLFGSNDEVS